MIRDNFYFFGRWRCFFEIFILNLICDEKQKLCPRKVFVNFILLMSPSGTALYKKWLTAFLKKKICVSFQNYAHDFRLLKVIFEQILDQVHCSELLV